MSTAFFWDKKKTEFICERRAWNEKMMGMQNTYLFVFNTPEDFIRLFSEERERIIYDERDTAWTVDLLRYEILYYSIVKFIKAYYIVEDEVDSQ